MKKIYAFITAVSLISVSFFSCSDDPVTNNNGNTNSISPLTASYDAKFPAEWMWINYKIVGAESRDNPPQAGRVYAYTCMAIYQCVLPGMPLNRSMAGQLKEYPVNMPAAYNNLEYDWPSAITGAMPVMLRGLFRVLHNSSNNMIINMYNRQKQDRLAIKDSAIVNRSLAYGEAVANAVLAWASTDGHSQIAGMTYNPPPPTEQEPWNWQPINPGDTCVEPYWGTLRTMALPSADYNNLPPSFPFDTTVGSPFWNEQEEIRLLKTNATLEQRQIALFWRDKQLTGQPPGHWVSILNQVVLRDNIPLDRAAELYCYMGIALNDAFIAAWWTKFHYNILRPQNYIRRFIDPNWTPLIPTPPFPDYTSGHSTGSGTVSYLLEHLLGNNVAFTDTTHLSIGMAPRSFNSFYEAAVECSNSRVYGGIHYRNACENGVIMGRTIGETIVNRVRLRYF